jgi:hypothetical protein
MLRRDAVLAGSQELRGAFTFKVPLPGPGVLAAQVHADAQPAFSGSPGALIPPSRSTFWDTCMKYRNRYQLRPTGSLVKMSARRASVYPSRMKSRMAKVSIAGFAAVVCLAGCIHQQPAVAPPAPVESAPAAQPPPVEPPASEPATSSPPTAPEPGTTPEPGTAPVAPSSAPTAEPKAKGASTATQPRPAGAKPSAANTAPKAAGSEPSTGTRPSAIAATGPQTIPVSPALDLASLEQRLRDTHAIGLFTKLSLKNQVDDLLQQFRAFHAGQSKPMLAELRQKYELLLLKVVSLLQDGDPPLAAAVSSSREAIWGILTDPEKFSKI